VVDGVEETTEGEVRGRDRREVSIRRPLCNETVATFGDLATVTLTHRRY